MRIWWLVLILTVSSVVTLLLAPPMSGHGEWCNEATAMIMVSPGYSDGEMAGSDPGVDRSTCAKAAWRNAGFATGVGLVGAAATIATRRTGIRRRSRCAAGGTVVGAAPEP